MTRTLQEIRDALKGNATIRDLIDALQLIMTGSTGGGSTSIYHNVLTNLKWSLAGHTIDTNIAMGTHKLTGLSVPADNGDSIRATAKITEALLESATDLKHTQGTDTTLGAMTANINMNTHKLISLSVPVDAGDSIRATAKITEAALESAIDLKHTRAHAMLPGSFDHSDSTEGTCTRGDIITAQGSSPTWTRYAISAPAANVLNVLGVANTETEVSWKTVLDGTNPTTIGIGDSAAPGTSLVFSHRDHQHASPATWTATAHAIDSATYHSIGSLTDTYLVKSNGTILVNATNTDAQVATAVTQAAGAVQNGALCGKITESTGVPVSPTTGDLWLQI